MLDLSSVLLKPQGLIYFEIHENQAKNMLELSKQYPITSFRVIKDMQGKDRMISMIYSPN
jgi:methylase of polypeptide subunit release factors